MLLPSADCIKGGDPLQTFYFRTVEGGSDFSWVNGTGGEDYIVVYPGAESKTVAITDSYGYKVRVIPVGEGKYQLAGNQLNGAQNYCLEARETATGYSILTWTCYSNPYQVSDQSDQPRSVKQRDDILKYSNPVFRIWWRTGYPIYLSTCLYSTQSHTE